VDVRHNTGGNARLLNPLLRTLIHFETTRPDARLFVVVALGFGADLPVSASGVPTGAHWGLSDAGWRSFLIAFLM